MKIEYLSESELGRIWLARLVVRCGMPQPRVMRGQSPRRRNVHAGYLADALERPEQEFDALERP
jgi:hypothetical protein